MRTLFNIVGFFTKEVIFGTGKRRSKQTFSSVIVLKKDLTLEEVQKIGYGNLEQVANNLAAEHSSNTVDGRGIGTKVWMHDWELESHAEYVRKAS